MYVYCIYVHICREELTQTSVLTPSTVLAQGLWDRSVVEHLAKAHGVPELVVDNRAAAKAGMHQKTIKAATNVRKH